MAKSPENMTPDERLKRIRSLERKVRDLERDKEWAVLDRASMERWAVEAWKEVRRLHDICTLHWTEKQEVRRAAGLELEPSYIPLAKFNHDTREWEPTKDVERAAPRHDGWAWLRFGWPKQGEWYDDGNTFEPAEADWADDQSGGVNVYKLTTERAR